MSRCFSLALSRSTKNSRSRCRPPLPPAVATGAQQVEGGRSPLGRDALRLGVPTPAESPAEPRRRLHHGLHHDLHHGLHRLPPGAPGVRAPWAPPTSSGHRHAASGPRGPWRGHRHRRALRGRPSQRAAEPRLAQIAGAGACPPRRRRATPACTWPAAGGATAAARHAAECRALRYGAAAAAAATPPAAAPPRARSRRRLPPYRQRLWQAVRACSKCVATLRPELAS
eukprot:scaffold65067_cov67-Phaeocystis_antarctica.AAC.7